MSGEKYSRVSRLVSVVIPAYNAAQTLDETLRSVRSQTHRALEIIVVDDGSTDDTRRVAERHAAVDDRMRVITQENAGVAAARNTGWQRATSDLIAFVDADDLWAPTKIERQVEAIQSGGRRVGLVYCWSAWIDGQSSITNLGRRVYWAGDVLEEILVDNFVGNGSSALIRREALVSARGFDSKLRAVGAEGCEDYLVYCRIAEEYHYAVVPEYLTGYRALPGNMSNNRARMLRSWGLVGNEMLVRHPGRASVIAAGLRRYARWLVRDTLSIKGLPQLWTLLWALLREQPALGIVVVTKDLPLLSFAKIRTRLLRARRHARAPLKGVERLQGANHRCFEIGKLH